jgi:multidrug efflux system outer membrane protein
MRRLFPLVLAAVTGCSFIPEMPPTGVTVPAAWSEEAASPWPDAEWWQAFGSPRLDALVAEARAANPDLAAAAARVLQAEAQTRISGATLWPTVDAGLDVSRQRFGSGRTGTGRVSRDRDVTAWASSIAASYELDLWGRNRAALAAAESSALASRFDRETVAITLTGNVAATYFQLLALRDRLELARRNLANAERVLEVVRARVETGAVSPLDLAQQRTVVANQRAQIPPLEAQARQAQNAIAVLLGRPPQGFALPPAGLASIRTPDIRAGLPSELLARRPDIRAAEARLAAANADVGAARAAWFPAVALTGQYGIQSAALSSLFDPSGGLLTVAAGLTQPIFQGGRLQAQEDLAYARREELVAAYRGAVHAAFADVEDSLVAASRSAEELALRAEAVDQARLALELAETRYRAGAVDLLAVLDAQRSLFQAEEQLVQTRLTRLQALVDLYRAMAGGF